MPDESNEATLELANEIVRERLETQKSGIERTETKTTLLLGFGLVGLQFVLTRARHTGWMLVAAIFFGLSLVSGLAGIFLYEHEFPPDPARLVDVYLDLPKWHVLDVLVRTRADAFYANTRHARFKRLAWFATLGSLAIAVGFSAPALWKGRAMSKKQEQNPAPPPPPAPPGKADPLLGGSTDTRGNPPNPQPRVH